MTDRFTDPETSIRPRRRRWRYVLALLCLIVFVAVGAYLFLTISAAKSLSAAVAEADRLDPRWRLKDVEADRVAVPDAENSAMTVVAAKQQLPKNWPFWESWSEPPAAQDPPDAGQKRRILADSFSELEPQRQLNDEQTTALRTEMIRAAGALAEARKLANLPQGRFPIAYSPDWIGTLRPHLQDSREVAHLLAKDALLRAQEGDADGALESCRAALNAARSIGDEPLPVSQLVRLSCRGLATGGVERVLAQGEPSEIALKQFQGLLEKEDKESLLLIAFRGERAGLDGLMEDVASGKVNLSDRDLDLTAGLGGQHGPSLGERLARWLPGLSDAQRAAMLRYMNRVVEIAKLPPEQRRTSFQQLEATAKDQPVLVRLLVPALSKVSESDQRVQAQLRCAIVALAAERCRRAKGRWPDTLDELKQTDYLQDIPADPFDGRPLRWLRLDDGAEVYSVGPDGEDNGGKMDRQHPVTPGTDIGIRLWAPAKRRQPAAPLPPPPGQDELGP